MNAGQVSQLDDFEQRERMREIYQLASALTGDFRRAEDDLRSLDQNVRVQMIEDGTKRLEHAASGTETVEFADRKGVRLKATIPTFIMSAELFPNSIEELSI